MAAAHIYQIFYNKETLGQLDPGFSALDNSSNERPDWREYWPIRRFLLGRTMVEEDYYGFLSPKFRDKTTLESPQVREFIARCEGKVDVVIFCPFSDMSSFFLNVFEQGDFFVPGLLATAQDLLNHIGWNIALDSLVTDSRNTIFCNYFVARPRFWKAWLELNEKLFQIAEGTADPDRLDLKQRLNAVAKRKGQLVQRKVFIVERAASLILAATAAFSSQAYSPFLLPRSTTQFRRFVLEAVACDSLKISFLEQRDAAYREAFLRVRNKVHAAIRAARHGQTPANQVVT